MLIWRILQLKWGNKIHHKVEPIIQFRERWLKCAKKKFLKRVNWARKGRKNNVGRIKLVLCIHHIRYRIHVNVQYVSSLLKMNMLPELIAVTILSVYNVSLNGQKCGTFVQSVASHSISLIIQRMDDKKQWMYKMWDQVVQRVGLMRIMKMSWYQISLAALEMKQTKHLSSYKFPMKMLMCTPLANINLQDKF